MFGSRENVVEIVIKKQKTVCVYLVLKELAAGVRRHIEPNGVGPFKKASLSHGNERRRGQQGEELNNKTPTIRSGALVTWPLRKRDHVIPRVLVEPEDSTAAVKPSPRALLREFGTSLPQFLP